MQIRQTSILITAATLTGLLSGGIARAHPHVFAEARLEVEAAKDGTIASLRHVWRFDDLFTSTVTLEFDADGNGEIDDAENEKLAGVISESIADYNYFIRMTLADKEVGFKKVTDLRALFEDGQMIIFFSAQPDEPVALNANPHISIYDPTFYTSIEFYDDDAMSLIGAPEGCGQKMVVPDIDAVLADSQSTLTEEFFSDPESNDYSAMFATRMEISCAG